MTEMDMWNLLAGFMSGNAVWFLGYIVAIWLGFRMTSNIYMTGDAPLIGKLLVTAYCLSVGAFMTMLMINTNQLFQDIASGFSVIGETEALSATAQGFIDQVAGLPALSPIQIVFIGSIVIMQVLQTWMKKAS